MDLLSQFVSHSLTGVMGWLFLAQYVPDMEDPLVVIGVLALLALSLLGACGAFDDKPKHPVQRSFDDYLDELQRESSDYLDKINDLYRKH